MKWYARVTDRRTGQCIDSRYELSLSDEATLRVAQAHVELCNLSGPNHWELLTDDAPYQSEFFLSD